MAKFYITTPLYYVNSKPHIGHSYTQIACDTLANFMRRAARDVFFMTGTDEHGEKIEDSALAKGYKPGDEKRFVDEIVPVFMDLWKTLGVRYDHFIRTTDESHIKSVQAVLAELNKRGKIYKQVYKGWFCTPCETFWSETQVPDGICPDCKRPAEKLDEANYFFKISEYQAWLIDYIKSHPDFIKPDFRRNEVLGFLNEPLLDLCISRPKKRMSWGIEVPFDKEFVTYVWFDALLNYISGIGYPHDMKKFQKYWPCDLHVIGKDILRHHAVYWPIILKALDLEPPKTIFAHGWWVIEGEKMSKSKGNVVDPMDMITKYGVEAYRYYLLSAVKFGLDGAFSEKLFVEKYNADLANDLGNLLNRTLVMAGKYFGSKAASLVHSPGSIVHSKELKAKTEALKSETERLVPNLEFSEALAKIWEVVDLANKFIEDSKPWALAKEKKEEELRGVISALLDALKAVSESIYPFMPATSENIMSQLKTATPKPLFPRIETKP